MNDKSYNGSYNGYFTNNLYTNNEVAIITGGATGIGLTIAIQLGTLGCKIAICGRRLEPIENAMKEFGRLDIEAYGAQCDIRDADGVDRYVADVLRHFGRIDILVNNAGGQYVSPAEYITPKGFAAVIRNNLVGTFCFTVAVANQAFIPQRSGRIVNVIAVINRGFPGMAHTGAARAGVDNLTKTLCVEWAKYNIGINSVAPGAIESSTSGTHRYPPELLKKYEEAVPAGRLGRSAEVASLVTYLASEKLSSFITGQTFYIDGGQSVFGDIWAVRESKL